MGIADQLAVMRDDFPQCRSVTFADLSSGLVLCASTQVKLRQERLDALCDRARALLSGPGAAAAAAVLGAAPDEAVLDEAGMLLVFVRSPVEPDEALCCECEPGIDLNAFTARAAHELASIGTPQ